jgi:hypothetical protein
LALILRKLAKALMHRNVLETKKVRLLFRKFSPFKVKLFLVALKTLNFKPGKKHKMI